MSVEANKKLVAEYAAAFNLGDSDRLRQLFAADAVVQGVLGWGGMDTVLPIWRELHDAFQIELTVEQIVAEGDLVAVRYLERGKFAGAFRGQQPTGKHYELTAMEFFEIKEGKIRRRWGTRDSAAQTRQIGLPPS